jgi:copper(I)-binding protein
MKSLITASLMAVATITSAWAQGSPIEVRDPWVRATVATQTATGAFMQLVAKANGRLVEARSPVAGVVEIHEMAMVHDVMRMRALSGGLALLAGQVVELKPGGYHVMLMDLKGQVKEGDTVPLTLVFEVDGGGREVVDVQAPVRPLHNAAASAHGGHDAHGGHTGHQH